MQANRGKDTGLELAVRRCLWARGVRGYRTNVLTLPGKPDIVFPRAQLCVFLHGCFWHGCVECAKRRNLRPKSNASYWVGKVARNRARDDTNRADLEASGWTVLVFWECEVKSDLERVVHRIATAATARALSR
ncbi:MAG: very short patch repair endonuclease [Armatimonadota bacterium]